MYAVVYKNRVIVGPMGWNRAIFQGSLAKEGVNQTLPRVVPEQLPYEVTPDAQIMAVQEDRPTLNPLVEYYHGPHWEVQSDKAIAHYHVFDIELSSARGGFKDLAAQERYRKEVAGITHVVQGHIVTLDTSREGRNIFLQKLALMTDTDVVNWKFPERWVTLTKADLNQIVAAGAAHIQICFDWEKQISDQIDQAQTKQELLNIQILEPEPTPSEQIG